MSNQLQHVKSAALSLAANKTRSALTMLGISIGVLAVTLLVSVGEGAKSSVETSLTSIGTNLLSVVPGRIEAQGFGYLGAAVRKPLVIEDSELLERQATHLAAVTPVVLGNASIQFAGRARSTNIFGVGPRFLDVRNIRLESGSFLSSEDIAARRRVVILGRTLVDSILDGKPAIGSSVRVGGERFRVVGVTERKGRSLGIDLDDMALVPVSVAAEFFEQTSLNQILAAAKSDTDAELASQQIDELLAGRRRGERSFTIQTQDDLLRVFDSITSAMSWTLLAIASISLVVGGVGVMNIMLVSVRERTREIGIRRAVGATKADILLQFLIESVLIALVGGGVGLVLGAGLVLVVSYSSPGVPLRLSASTVFLAFGSAFVVGTISGVVPARQAAELDPAQALRFE